MTLPALAQDGSIADRTTLVMPSPAVERLALPSRFLLKHKERAAVLDKLSSVRSAPTVQMLLDAFADDGGNFTALHPRLQRFTGFTEPGDDNRLQLAKLPIIPLHSTPLAPSALAFIGPKGDYWGARRTRRAAWLKGRRDIAGDHAMTLPDAGHATGRRSGVARAAPGDVRGRSAAANPTRRRPGSFLPAVGHRRKCPMSSRS